MTPEGDGVMGMGERGPGEQKRREGKVDSHHLSRPASGAEGHLKVAEEPSRASPLPRRPVQGPSQQLSQASRQHTPHYTDTVDDITAEVECLL